MSGHKIEFHPQKAQVEVRHNGVDIAKTDHAVVLQETGLPPVCYIPIKDVKMDLLVRTEHTSHCPYKGQASYWTIKVGETELANAVWGYEEPIEAAATIAGHIAFYSHLVDHYTVRHPLA